MGALQTIPIRIGMLTGTKPHILNGVNTNSPLSFVDEFISSIPLIIFYFSSLVTLITLSSPYPSELAKSLNFLTVSTPSRIS